MQNQDTVLALANRLVDDYSKFVTLFGWLLGISTTAYVLFKRSRRLRIEYDENSSWYCCISDNGRDRIGLILWFSCTNRSSRPIFISNALCSYRTSSWGLRRVVHTPMRGVLRYLYYWIPLLSKYTEDEFYTPLISVPAVNVQDKELSFQYRPLMDEIKDVESASRFIQPYEVMLAGTIYFEFLSESEDRRIDETTGSAFFRLILWDAEGRKHKKKGIVLKPKSPEEAKAIYTHFLGTRESLPSEMQG